MGALGKSRALLRLGTVAVLLGYLFAGASLALPPEFRCTRCAKLSTPAAMKPGTSCPLSHHGHDCHTTQGKSAGQITLCPDGCLRHDGQNGEIPSLAKFLSAPASYVFSLPPVGPPPEEASLSVLDLSFPPPDRPPPARL